MNWSNPAEFFAMGGYAFYVWGSYVVAAVCIAVELWWLTRRTRTLLRRRGHNVQQSARQP